MKRTFPIFSVLPILLAVGLWFFWSEGATSRVDATPSEADRSSNPLTSAIEQYIRMLEQEEGFTTWQGATWTKHPLGPGIRGWVVILERSNEEVGYLVIYPGEDDRDFVLGEYGTGPYPLFSMATLYQSLIQHELISNHTSYSTFIVSDLLSGSRIHLDSLYSFWRLNVNHETYFFDAKTGEQWFMSDEQYEELMHQYRDIVPDTVMSSEPPGQVAYTNRRDPFDPFDDLSWLVKQPLTSHHVEHIQEAVLNNEDIVYAAHLLNQQLLKPYAVTGIQEWDQGGAFLILEEDGARYIPLGITLLHGSFYP